MCPYQDGRRGAYRPHGAGTGYCATPPKDDLPVERTRDFIFPGLDRTRPCDRNSVRTRCLHRSIKRANRVLEAEGKAPIPEWIGFHSMRRTYAAVRAELGEHPAITAAQMCHTDPRMTLRIYTDVPGEQPRTHMSPRLQ